MTDLNPKNLAYKDGFILAALALLMFATRSDHFGSAISLPDASLAVFFLAGYFLNHLSRRLAAFVGLCALAAATDYWAIAHRGVSDFCVTGAYGFLLPAYYLAWWAGERAPDRPLRHRSAVLTFLALALLATSGAFLISSGSFYLLAPYFSDRSLVEFGQRIALYFPRYLGVTLGYLALAMALHTGLTASGAARAAHND